MAPLRARVGAGNIGRWQIIMTVHKLGASVWIMPQ